VVVLTVTFSITVLGVSSIAVTTQPTKTTYDIGDTLDITGLVVIATYSDNSIGEVTITTANITGFDSVTAGEKELTVTYGGNTATFTITVTPDTETVAMPAFSLASGTQVVSNTPVTITSVTGGATIHCTTDGSDPITSGTKESGVSPYTTTISGTVGSTVTVKAYATKDDMLASEVVTTVYTIKDGVAPPLDPITSVAITITAPVRGETPSTTANIGTVNFTAGTVTWSPNHSPFQGGVVYTATVTLTANSDYTFIGLTTATINEQSATVATNTGTTVTLSSAFPQTINQIVTGISILNQPSKLSYNHGETLNLTGLEVQLTFNSGSPENVAFANFADKGITTNPANGTTLSVLTHDNEPVKITYGSLTPVNTNNLTVNAVVPSAPRYFAATPGDGGAIDLTWEAPVDNGGRTISRYEVSSNNGVNWTTATSNTAHTFTTGLSITGNTFVVRAVNPIGNGAQATTTATPEPNRGMDGTPSKPWKVFNPEMLSYVGKGGSNPTGYTGWTNNANYELIIDIDMSSASNHIPSNLNGTFDGKGHSITGLIINVTNDNVGLFGTLESDGMVKNLALININFTVSSTGGTYGAGGVVGKNYGTVQNCSVSGGSVSASYSAGGIVGINEVSSALVQYCYATASVTSTRYAGGIVGMNFNATVKNCVARNVSITSDERKGRITSYGSTGLSNNYADSAMSGSWNADDIVTTVYVGSQNQAWWRDTVGWDFTNIWEWNSTVSLPKLKVQQ